MFSDSSLSLFSDAVLGVRCSGPHGVPQGLLRSHVTCPECQHSSVTFDPYTSLSLPLPTETDVMVRRHGTWHVYAACSINQTSKSTTHQIQL